MPPQFDLVLPPLAAVVSGGLAAARMAGFVAVGSLPLAPGMSVTIRLMLGLALAAAAVPLAVSQPCEPAQPLALAALAEGLLGGLAGLAVACLTAAAGWAGNLVGRVSGLSWADEFTPGGTGEAGIGRLAWWIAAAAFLACGGARIVVAGLLDTLVTTPPGSSTVADLAGLLVPTLARSFALAVALALPVLVALLAFHVTAAVICRSLPLTPVAGLLPSLAATVLAAAMLLGAGRWSNDIGESVAAFASQALDSQALELIPPGAAP